MIVIQNFTLAKLIKKTDMGNVVHIFSKRGKRGNSVTGIHFINC